MNLFVYGSLREGRQYHYFLEGAARVAKRAWTEGVLYDTGLGYPGMIPGEGTVYGEVYRVDKEQLSRIDRLEEFYGPGDPRNVYERVLRTVHTPSGPLACYVYLYTDEEGLRKQGRRISSGDWCE